MMRRRVWHNRERMGLKIAGAAGATFLLSFLLCLIMGLLTPFALLLLVFLVPWTPLPVMFCVGFLEQRLRRHLVPALAAAVSGLLAFRLFIVNLSEEEVLVAVCLFLPAMWLTGLLGSVAGIAASKSQYEIVVRLRGTCPACGYCLRGLPDKICPECGRPFTLEEIGVEER